MKQTRSNTIQKYFRKKLYCQIQNVRENLSINIVLKSKNCKWIENSKN